MKTALMNDSETSFISTELVDVFASEGRISYVNLFVYYFNCIPNKYEIGNVNTKKMREEICSFYSDFIIKEIDGTYYDAKIRHHYRPDNIVLFNSGEMLVFERNHLTYFYDKEELLPVSGVRRKLLFHNNFHVLEALFVDRSRLISLKSSRPRKSKLVHSNPNSIGHSADPKSAIRRPHQPGSFGKHNVLADSGSLQHVLAQARRAY